MLGNYFKPSSKGILKVSLALKTFIATISGAAYFSGNKDATIWFLVAGAFIDFIINCVSDDTAQVVKDNAGKVLVLALIISVISISCKTLQRGVDTEKTDSTWTTYKQVDAKVTGAAVTSAINMDSLASDIKRRLLAAAKQGGSVNIDSLLNAAVTAFKDELKSMPPAVVTDPESKVQLKYWYDQYGKLTMECASKDQTLQMMVAEINRMSKERKTETVVDYQPVWYTWAFLGWAIFATALVALLFFIRK